MRSLAGLLAAAVALAAGQHWEFEQVDTAGWDSPWVELERHPDGHFLVAYGDQPGTTVRVATEDSTWTYEDVPAPTRGCRQYFCVSPTGVPGIAYADSSYHAALLERRDSVWVGRTTAYEPVWAEVPLAYDSSGNAMLLCNADLGHWGVVCITLENSSEVVDTVLWSSSPYWNYSTVELTTGPDDRVWALVLGGYSFPGTDLPGDPPWTSELFLTWPAEDSWERTQVGGGTYVGISAASLAAGVGQAVTCQREAGGSGPPCRPDTVNRFTCDHDSLDTLAWAAAVTIDDSERLCLAYTRPGELTFMYRDSSGWHRRLVSTATDPASRLDIEMDTMSRPVIAFTTQDGVWLAHGVDVLPMDEQTPAPVDPGHRPTIVRLPYLTQVEGRVFDAQGRDVSARRQDLPPGTYFVQRKLPGTPAPVRPLRKLIAVK